MQSASAGRLLCSWKLWQYPAANARFFFQHTNISTITCRELYSHKHLIIVHFLQIQTLTHALIACSHRTHVFVCESERERWGSKNEIEERVVFAFFSSPLKYSSILLFLSLTAFKMESACEFNLNYTIYPVGYRTHGHNIGMYVWLCLSYLHK